MRLPESPVLVLGTNLSATYRRAREFDVAVKNKHTTVPADGFHPSSRGFGRGAHPRYARTCTCARNARTDTDTA